MSSEPIFQVPPVTVHALFSPLTAERRPWSIEQTGIRKLGPDRGKGILIAIGDTGIDKYHVHDGDLKGKVVRMEDFTGSQVGPYDTMGHGSHVCGIACGLEDSDGGCGVAPAARITFAKLLGDDGFGTEGQLVNGLESLRKQRPSILSLSLGSHQRSDRIAEVLEQCTKDGIVVFCAAGNYAERDVLARSWPAMLPFVVSVASTNQLKQASSYSEPSSVDIACPGEKIFSLGNGGTYVIMSGTSMATPWAASFYAVYLGTLAEAGKPFPTPNEAFALLAQWAEDIGAPGRDEKTGPGLISYDRYVATLPPHVTPAPPVPDQPTDPTNPTNPPAPNPDNPPLPPAPPPVEPPAPPQPKPGKLSWLYALLKWLEKWLTR